MNIHMSIQRLLYICVCSTHQPNPIPIVIVYGSRIEVYTGGHGVGTMPPWLLVDIPGMSKRIEWDLLLERYPRLRGTRGGDKVWRINSAYG